MYTSLKQRQDCHCFKENVGDMRKSIVSIGAHVHTHVRGTFIPAHTKADRLHNSTKVKLRSVLPDFTSLFILSKVPHSRNPFLPYKGSTTLVFSDMSSGRTEGHLCNRACKTFLAHCPTNLEMWFPYSPEKNARFGSKSK